jgi:hypothetical protein
MTRRQSAQAQEAVPESGPEDVREASMRLPERQREALTLRGAERRSYEEIAAIMETSLDSVAQLISRARINLYDELRGTVLASVAPPSPDCERALPLIAARDDEQLEASSGDAAWLDDHLTGCDRCRLGEEQMREADASYRSQASIGAAKESPSGTPADAPAGVLPASSPARRRFRLPRSRAVLAGALVALLMLGGLAVAFVGKDDVSAPETPAADAASGRTIGKSLAGAKRAKAANEKKSTAKKKAPTPTTTDTNPSGASATDATAPFTVPTQSTSAGAAPSEPDSGPTHRSGSTGVEPTQRTSTPKPKPAPSATPTSEPASAPAPTTTTEAAPPAEEPADAPGRSDEAPGKPSGHPSH